MRALALLLLLAATPALGEVRMASPDGFVIHHEGLKPVSPAAAWAALVNWGGWWPDAHTYSGEAANLSLDVEADGELEEEWVGGTVLHGSILQAQTAKLLRLSAALGPLQSLPVNGILDFSLKPEGNGTHITVTYRVGGPSSLDIGQFAAPVDRVFAEALERLVAHVPPPPETEK